VFARQQGQYPLIPVEVFHTEPVDLVAKDHGAFDHLKAWIPTRCILAFEGQGCGLIGLVTSRELLASLRRSEDSYNNNVMKLANRATQLPQL
jgi:hypothetical protein